MKTQIRAKLGQKQKLSVQLQHAIKLMAMPTLELQTHIQATLDENPLLEVDEPETQALTAGQRDKDQFPGDEDWLSQVQSTVSLQDHLSEQCEMLSLDPKSKEVAQTIIDSINETGYLQYTIADLFPDMLLPEQEYLIRSVLHQIQQFDPPGIAARSLSECLLLQLPHLKVSDEIMQIANQIIHHHMKALAQNNVKLISGKLGASEPLVKEAIAAIKNLHPKPGLQIDNKPVDSVIPDFSIKVDAGEISIELNANLPNIKVKEHAEHPELRELLAHAKEFIYHLHLRNQSLLAVAQSIANHQHEFFKKGSTALKPLTLEAVAKDTALHVSTLSRMTQQKHVHTPFGVFALKYFFNSAIAQADAQDLGNKAVQQHIEMLIAEENKQKPLSDNEIVDLLAKKGITLSRRTVAKYRDKIGIPSSVLRKRLEE